MTDAAWHDDYGDVRNIVAVGPYHLNMGGYISRRIRNALYGSPKTPLEKKEAISAAVFRLQCDAADAGKKPEFGHAVKALQIEQKFIRSRANETF